MALVVIGLDAAEPLLLEHWLAAGHLPALQRLRAEGAYGRLATFETFRAEIPWTTFLTGCRPEKTGYWSPLAFRADDYSIAAIDAYPFTEYPPFYALGDTRRVAVFDVPHSRLVPRVDGVQVVAWGAHSPLAPSASIPPDLLADLIARHGEHPALHRDEATLWRPREAAALCEALRTGVARRVAICRDLLQRAPWDLFLTVFGETHSAQHYLWHHSQEDHPLYRSGGDAMLAVFRDIDQGIARLIDAAPPDARVLVFSTHGMEANCMDLPSMVFLPELLYRFAFPGKTALAAGDRALPAPPPIEHPRRSWVPAVWSLQADASALRRFLRRNLPSRLAYPLDSLLGGGVLPRRPIDCGLLGYQPAMWYQPLWPQMPAFALPSFSDGYIRINVRGRERAGIVDPAAYDDVCTALTQHLRALVNARTGEPIANQILRTRASALEDATKLPDADLVVTWRSGPADVVDSTAFGRIGPVPFYRAASHTARGFLLAKGGDIPPGSRLPDGHTLDLAPTILTLLGAPLPPHLDGRSLIPTTSPAGRGQVRG